MPPRGSKPKPAGQAVTRHRPVHGWIEVDPTPFTGGPALPASRRNGDPWPQWARETWEAWRSMPHARLWGEADWQFASDTIELAVAAFTGGAKGGLLAELRYREKIMGTTWSARQDMRISYTVAAQQKPSPPSDVAILDRYREL